MRMFFEYQSELWDRNGFENETGFVTFKITGPECYIVDIFIWPHLRRTKAASTLADQVAEVAKSKGCKFLTCTVSLAQKNPTLSTKAVLGYGFELVQSNADFLIFKKDL